LDGGALKNDYGLSNATSVQKQQLEQMQTKMNLLSKQISQLNTKFGEGTYMAVDQTNKNQEGLGEYLSNLIHTNKKIKHFSSNMDNILNDSDITVLQKNYEYLFWTILAAGTVLVSMNIVKKNN
jgi:hypothetical protein